MDDWRAKEATQDVMRQAIYDFLYSDETGLPETFSSDEIAAKSLAVFSYVYSEAR